MKTPRFIQGFPNYAAFLASFEPFLKSGVEGENIRYCAPTTRDMTEEFYDEKEDDAVGVEFQNARRGRPEKLKPKEQLRPFVLFGNEVNLFIKLLQYW